YESHLVIEGEKLGLDRAHKRRGIAARQVGAADRSLEQDVADQTELQGLIDENHAPRRMPGAMPYVERRLAERHVVALIQPAVGSHVAAGESEKRGGFLQIVEQELVADLR